MDTAIIGMAFRFPGADDSASFWENLIHRKSSVTEVPAERWDWRALWGDPKSEINKTYSKWGGFVSDADAFDNQFFGFLPKVVQTMDPQQRIMLELAWNCMEDAGVAPSSLRGRNVAVVVGVFNHDYKELQERDEISIEAHHSTGTATTVIANRVSHFFDFRGPSMPVDTACSSSLNAIHNAIQALEYDGCDVALAGGINLMLTPTRHISFSKMGMLSPTGTCKTFDDTADGYVRGEGAAFLLLKPLHKAIADGDTIHGVIKGTAVNHCGGTYTLTYPSPRAQAEVIIAAHERAGVPVDTLSFIELHGTGTPKGDPIEFEGLVQAFDTLSQRQGVTLPSAFCGVSSVKTNIGHLEAAAGVAGVIKVLMAMQHQRLPAFQNFNKLNSGIVMDGTPFYPLGDSLPWLPPSPGVPLRAGISSFGFGGTNAHLVLEAPPPQPIVKRGKRKPVDAMVLIALSAKTTDALRIRIESLRDWLRGDEGRTSLDDLSRTLLLGRDAMSNRFACVVDGYEALLQALDAALLGDSIPKSRNVEGVDDEALQVLFSRWPTLKKSARTDVLLRAADAFRDGATLPWPLLFDGQNTRPVRLPGYPFARERFWIPVPITSGASRIGDNNGMRLHPLLHANVSTLGQLRFSSVFDGREFFLADHVIGGRSVLPGVACLEMVREAARCALALSAVPDVEPRIRVVDVVWLRPIEVVDDAVQVELELTREDDFDAGSLPARLGFRIIDANGQKTAQVFCRGHIEVDLEDGETLLDIDAISADCAAEHDADRCYQMFNMLGLQYGPAHKAIVGLRVGDGQCLAKIALPEAQQAGSAAFAVHPSTADAALQTAVALVVGVEQERAVTSQVPCLPFALDRLDIAGPLAFKNSSGVDTRELYAWARLAPGTSSADRIPKVDIDLIERTAGQSVGRVRLSFRGLSIRPRVVDVSAIESKVNEGRLAEAVAIPPPSGLADALFSPLWVDAALSSTVQAPALVLLIGFAEDIGALQSMLEGARPFIATRFERLCILPPNAEMVATDAVASMRAGSLVDAEAQIAAWKVRGALPEHVVWIAPRSAATMDLQLRIDAGARSVFALVKAMFRGPKRLRIVHLSPVVTHKATGAVICEPDTAGLGGFYKTLSIEKPAFDGRVVHCSVDGLAAGQIAQCVADELLANDKSTDVRYVDGRREVRTFVPIASKSLQQNSDLPSGDFREGGAYLITGGMGALGLIVARHLCAKYRATVYLTGRSSLSDTQQIVLDELVALGGRAVYHTCDVGNREHVSQVVAAIRDDLGASNGHLNGVLHSAGVIEDNFLLRKAADSFARVITPKTLGTWHLDLETRDEPLDLFVVFSSVTGVLGNVGQSDYAFANAFEDAFVAQREKLRSAAERNGRSLTINWPYWKDGGMRLNDKEEEALHRSFGIVPLQTQHGIEVLEYAVRQAQDQIVVMPPGNLAKINEVLNVPTLATPGPAGAEIAEVAPIANVDGDGPAAWSAAVSRHLAELFASELDISSDFEHDRSFKDYGFDSVVMIDLIADLEKRFGTLPKTLFFEYQTLGELTGYFIEQHPEHCRRIARPESDVASTALKIVEASANKAASTMAPPRAAAYLVSSPSTTRDDRRGALSSQDDIAIVGLAGRYPKAETLEDFWENLRIGRDCIEEIPADRPDIADKFRFQSGDPARASSYGRWGSFLRNVDHFDPLFFNISPKEAEKIDPNERLFLETASLLIENAGYTPDTLAKARGYRENPVGVYVGLMWGDYQLHGVDRPRDHWTVPHSLYWAVANRVSYQFNFSGPSLIIDTACSSSLSAIHLACQAIRQGEIDVAIAGAVNLSLHPNKYNLLSDMHFLSSDGRCRAFGEGGDGYVPGEGVGAVLLKPLSKARQDGDHIYGIIRGSAINHGGKASGFTVPNPRRQAALVQEALDTAGVDSRHISYLEAHGTGTSLGDPIEIAGLTKAFAQSEHQYCAIGSAKSNIGHLEAAAGIAGLTKVLLQMQHRSLVPSIHSDVPNPFIDFEKSPFRVQRELQPWHRPVLEVDGLRRELPRIAGLSSFGAGGSNGHIIVEEYVDETRVDSHVETPVVVVLSARRDLALREMAVRLASHLDTNSEIDLQNAAYTLQIGRIAMEFRIAFVATSRHQLISALRAYGQENALTDQAWSGHRDAAKRDPIVAARLAALTERLPHALRQRDLAGVAQAWAEGAKVDWAALHLPDSRRRVPLPGYAFQRQRYWIDTTGEDIVHAGTVAMLHPLIDANVSTLDEQAFIKTFSPEAFYLRDHRLSNNRILPGVVYLELALQAARLAVPGRPVAALEDVRWLRPVIVNDAPQPLRISLLPSRGGIAFEVCAVDDAARRPYAHGTVVIAGEHPIHSVTDERIDLLAIVRRTETMVRVDIDAAFEAMGFVFGESFRTFERLHHSADEALGVLHLSHISGSRAEDFVLHPALLDSAIRVCLGVGGFAAQAGGIRVPVQLRRIDIFDVLGERIWVYARRSENVQDASAADQSHFDLQLCNAEGRVLVRIEQLTIRSAPQLALAAQAARPSPAMAKAPPVVSVQSAVVAQATNTSVDSMLAVATASLATLLASVTKLPVDQIDPHASLENYGIDSVMIATLNRELESRYADIPKTLFFEYQELNGIADYLVENHSDTLRSMMPAAPLTIPSVSAALPFAADPNVDADASRRAVVGYLRRAIGETIGLAAAEVDPNAALENYGIDSVMIVKLTTRLEEAFGPVSKTLFFEYQDIVGLAEHLTESFADTAHRMADAHSDASITMPALAIGVVNSAEITVANEPSTILDTLLSHMKRTLGADAGRFRADTPISEWPLDPVNLARLQHALSLDFEGVDAFGPYRHTTLKEWAGTLQWRSERTSAAVTTTTPTLVHGPGPTASHGFRRFRSGFDRSEPEDIAIVGLSGRYPGANDLHSFWQNISAGRDCITEIPSSRWDYSRHFHPDRSRKGAVYSKWGGFIEDVDQFDARFFNISAREAELIDPQERLFLQTVWECVEDACYTRKSLKGNSVGVFVGVMWGYYAQIDVTDEQLKSGRPSPPFSSIANRVSYVMNFNGPSMAVDTMCSSSLTAIHLSCRAIHNGDCDMAIAGGVNVIVHPNKYQKLSAAQFLSSDGRCRAFGEGGDGYVPGEGVGAVLLKRLSRAIEDGDHIYGVVKATSLNHGGKTNGYTVPNQVAQTNVIGSALKRTGWDPRSIDYIEAHGTGTSLGDPIEIAGLTRAFTTATRDVVGTGAVHVPQQCRIGSVKSNVGHLESAAAIAGLTKILLQFRHNTIAPSLHSATLNSNIDFARSPFRVVQQAEAWQPLDVRTPRRAGLSSFGAGGANGHCLVEDHPRQHPHQQVADGRPMLFVLSADSEVRLIRYVERVIAFLERGGDPDVGLDLPSLAYASQIGRETMDERLVVVAASVENLLAGLLAYRAGTAHEGLLRGSPRQQGEKLDTIVDDREKDSLIRSLIVSGRLIQLARVWVSYLDIDWARFADVLYPATAAGARPRRMPFPTMPFLTERYWVEEKRADATADALHPLIDRNLSTLDEQIYRKRFDGQEFYLRDHIVHTDRDRKILPGVAYLEMARAAGDLAIGENWHADRICNLMWRQPFEIAGSPDSLTVRMHSDDAGLRFEIARDSDGVICVDGELGFREAGDVVEDEWLDIDSIIARGTLVESSHEDIYAGFRRMGFHFGPSFQVTQARYLLAEGALCRLQLPEHLRSSREQFTLHPSLLDAALRAGLAVNVAGNGQPVVPIVPFALEELEYRHPLTEVCYAHVVRSRDAVAPVLPDGPVPGAEATAYKYDIVITDADGRVLAKLHGFAGRPLIRQPIAPPRTVQFYSAAWLPVPLSAMPIVDRKVQTVLIISNDDALAEAIARALPAEDRFLTVMLATDADREANRFDPFSSDSATALLSSLRDRDLLPDRIVLALHGSTRDALSAEACDQRALLLGVQAVRRLFMALEWINPGAAVRLLYAWCSDGHPQPQHEAILGYARSLLTVNHRFELSTFCNDSNDVETFARSLVSELDVVNGFGAQEIAWRDGVRRRRSLQSMPMILDEHQVPLPLHDNGVYLITGGGGKLGLVIAHWLVTQCRGRLLLSGRSAQPSDRLRKSIDTLRSLGGQVEYFSADTSDANAVAELVATVERKFGTLNGVIHCAGVASARSILDLDDPSFDELLAPKIDGVVLLDRATAKLRLDFFVTFSSVSALIGDLGSGAYAVGNRFMDAYASWRNSLCTQGLRHGRSLSIGWPLWAAGGMEINGGEASVFSFSGLQAMTEAEGLDTFATLLRGQHDYVLVAVGDPLRIAKTLRLPESASPAISEVPSTTMSPIRVPATVIPPSERPTPLAARAAKADDLSRAHGPFISVSPRVHVVPMVTRGADVPGESDLSMRVEHHVRERMAIVTKIRAESIDARASFEQCGMDSVQMLELHTALRADFVGLPKTALFEYDSVSQLAQYLVANHDEAVHSLFTRDTSVSVAVPTAPLRSDVMPAFAKQKSAPPLSTKRMPAARNGAPSVAEGIAIIGIAGEFPASPDLESFWQNLREGHDCITPIPKARGFASLLNQHRSRAGRSIPDKGGFLADIDMFDTQLFRMSQSEADKADPQLRVLLRTAWRAIEDAAYTPEAMAASNVGVFVGAMNEDFTRIAAELQARSEIYIGPGSVSSELSNRLSYLMNFRGPSLTVSTACSASLTALHLARRSILAGDCDVALVGGINLSLHQSKYQLLNDMKVLSPDGQERAFDEAANGLVPGEGSAAVILKPLSRAIADGDYVYGVIRATRISHAGTGAGQFIPNLRVMEDIAADCIQDAGLSGDDITCIESHGTGTELGDPIELKALANALRRTSSRVGYCTVGSKAAVGHMEAASGLGSLIKVLLSMRHGEVAPCAKLKRVNTSFDHARSPFLFPEVAMSWPRNSSGIRIAGINSFGMGGANAFAVVSSYESVPAEHGVGIEPAVFVLSARSVESLRVYAATFVDYLRKRVTVGMSPASFADTAYATQIGRIAYRHRLAVVASDVAGVIAALEQPLDDSQSRGNGLLVGDTDARISADMLRLLSGDAGAGFIDTLIRARDLGKIAEFWVRGAAIDWSSLHHGQSRRRTSFPGTPFEQVRCNLRHLVDGETLSSDAPIQSSVGLHTECDARPVSGEWLAAEPVLSSGWCRLADILTPDLDVLDIDMQGDGELDAGLRRYWVEHLGDSTETVVDFGDSLLLDTAIVDTGESGEVNCVSELIDPLLVCMLQEFGARHGIALETLVSAAWALLLNRYTKARCSQFGLLGAISLLEPVLLPVRVRTVGRHKVLEWLSDLQTSLLRKHRRVIAPLNSIGEWVGYEPLFDCVLVFDSITGDTKGERSGFTSKDHSSQPRPRLELVAATGEGTLELSLIYRAITPNHAAASTLLEQFKVLLEGIVSNPDKMPSALGMRTRSESREKFWEVFEATTE